MEKATLKLKTEMDTSKNNPYIQVVGEFLLQHIQSNPQDAEKIMATDKTIAKSLDEMKKVAEKKKVGNCAVLTDQEGFEIVLKYFGIEKAGKVQPPAPIPIMPKPSSDFDVKLEDFI